MGNNSGKENGTPSYKGVRMRLDDFAQVWIRNGSGSIEDLRDFMAGYTFLTSPDISGHRFPLYATSVGKYRYYRGLITHRTGRPDHQIIYTHEGRARVTVDDATQALTPGSIVMIDCMRLHEFEADCDEGWVYSYVHIAGEGVATYHTYLVDKLRVLYPRDTSQIESAFESLLSGELHSDPLSCARIVSLIAGILSAMMGARFDLSDPSRDMAQNALYPALVHIRRNYMRPITLDDLAEQTHVSKYHFAHVFKQTTGLSPYQYITQYRIKQAKRILRSSREPIAGVAAQVGFPTVSRFIYQFTRLTGVTPAAYRNGLLDSLSIQELYSYLPPDGTP